MAHFWSFGVHFRTGVQKFRVHFWTFGHSRFSPECQKTLLSLSHGLVCGSNATSAFILHNEETHFLDPSDHTLLSSSSAELLQEITTSGIYLVPSGKIPFNCNQCNFSCTRKTLEESQFLTAHTHRASAVSLGLEITSGSACVCPTQLGQ